MVIVGLMAVIPLTSVVEGRFQFNQFNQFKQFTQDNKGLFNVEEFPE